jgi:hypothetical protein
LHSQPKPWKRRLALKVFFCVGLAFVILVTILAFAPSEPIWTSTKQQLEARGEVLDWKKFIPPAVPADENLFEHPMAASLLPLKGQPAPPNPLNVSPSLAPGTDRLGIPYAMSNLVTLPRTASSNEVSLVELDEWFARCDEAFAQLREAGKRPKVVWPGDYSSPNNSPMPNFVAIRTLAQVLVSRAKVHLVVGDSNGALEDLDTLAVVMKSLEAQPRTIVTAMIHVAIAGLYTAAVEEGLRQNLWRENELKKLIPRLCEINLLPAFAQGIRGERAAVLRHLTALAQRKADPLYQETKRLFGLKAWTMERLVINFSPPHWVRRSQADYAMVIQGYLDAIDTSAHRIKFEELNRVAAEVGTMQSKWRSRISVFSYVLPNLSNAFNTVARNQTKADQLAVACALELYRTKNQNYPSDLRALVPEFLSSIPRDVYNGKEIGYKFRDKGYELLSSNPQVTPPGGDGNFVWAEE